jgi:hypothetical protein
MREAKKRLPRGVYITIVLVLALVGLVLTANVSYTVKVTEAQAQTLLDAQLVKLRAKGLPYDIDHVTVHFVDDHMTVEAAGGYKKQIRTFPELAVTATLSSVGAPKYQSGSIYFLAPDFSLDSFLLNNEEPSILVKQMVDTFATGKVGAIRDKLLARPSVLKMLDHVGVSVGTAKNDVAIAAAATAVDGLVDEYRKPAREVLEKGVRDILEHTPLYTLGKNWKEQVALAALSDISIKDGMLTATLTGYRLLWTIFAAIIATAIAVLMVMLVVSTMYRDDDLMPS